MVFINGKRMAHAVTAIIKTSMKEIVRPLFKSSKPFKSITASAINSKRKVLLYLSLFLR